MLPKELFSGDTSEVNGAVREMSDFSALLQAVLDTLGFRLSDCTRLLSTVIGLLLLSAVFSALRGSVRSESVGKAFSFASSLAILSAILVGGYTSMDAVATYLVRLNTATAASIPLLGVLYSIGGNVTAAAASSTGLTLYLGIMENLIGRTVIPFCGICLSFSWISASGLGLRIGTLLSTFKKHYTTLLGFLMTILLAMLAAQTTLGASADSLAMRSAKFAAGNLIPVVGGSVAELLRTVSAGVKYLRTTLGICGILLILLMLLPTLTELFLYRLAWQIAASVADLLGCDSEKKLLDEIASLNGYLIAAVSICSSVLLISFVLLSRCASAIG
ncbi:MAG: hypothetical protein IKC59_02885 [Clostridia bacterium]|nr:hypothetical protein [Clostridia bacterium]